MKTFIFSSLFLLMSLGAFSSEIVISAFDRSEIYVNIDGYRSGGQAKELILSNLVTGNHIIEVFAEKHTPRHGFYFVKIFSGEIFVPGNSRIYAKVNAYNDLVVIGNEPLHNSYNNNYSYNSGNNYNYGNNCGNGLYTGDDYTYNYENSGCTESFNNHDYHWGMNDAQLSALKRSMMNTSFDSNKLNIAKTAISSNGIRSTALLEIMSLLSFDSNRLELAKFSYSYLVDKGNAFMICEGFTFSSNANEFLEFIH